MGTLDAVTTGPGEPVTDALAGVDPAQWRTALARGLQRRLDVLEHLDVGDAQGADHDRSALATARARLAALECDDPTCSGYWLGSHQTGPGTVEDLRATAGRALNR